MRQPASSSFRIQLPSLVAIALVAAGCGGGIALPKVDMAMPACTGPNCTTQTGGTCSSDVDCTDSTKSHCDPVTQKCLGCLQDSDCDAGLVCSPTAHTCTAGCSASHGCPAASGTCEVDSGACVECLSDVNCAAPNTRCDPAQNRCFVCNPVGDNCGFATYCGQQGSDYDCLPGCKNDNDCSGGSSPTVDLGVSNVVDAAMSVDASQFSDGGGASSSSDGSASDGGGDAGTNHSGNPNGAHCSTTSHQCVRCVADDDCPAGRVCNPSNQCVPGCTDAHACANGLSCCGAAGMQQCIDTTSDFQNCGGCGVACNGGFNCCNSMCTNPNEDLMNCGTCGTTCSAPNGSPRCVSRSCGIAQCNPGWEDCNGVIMDGCERHVASDPNNCGGCGNACSITNAQSKCLNGNCAVGTCLFPYGDCDGQVVNGCETNTNVDPKNCGGCAQPCSSVNISNPTCTAGQCNALCNTGFGDCNGNKQTDGCETSLASDGKNCGSCGNVCDTQCIGNVTATTCGNSACAITTCSDGFFDADGSCTNGCECKATIPDSTMSSCAAPIDLGTLTIGHSIARPVSLLPFSQVAWYTVTFSANVNDIDYHPMITLSTNPGNAFVFDVYLDCAGTPLTLAAGGCSDMGISTARTTWEKYYDTSGASGPAPDPNSPAGFLPLGSVGNNGQLYIKVRYNTNTANKATCDPFTLTVSN